MTDMEKVNVLYGMKAERLEKSPFGARQAKVYREMIEFMKDCKTAEEATKKIKASKYYLAPSIALTEDMILAWKAAAEKAGMTDLVRVYDEKLSEIASDGTAIYDVRYQEAAKRERAAYISTKEAFLLTFRAWITLRLTDRRDRVALSSSIRDLAKQVANYKKPSKEFSVLAADPDFRAIVPLSDAWYECFVRETQSVLRGVLPEESVKPVTSTDIENEWRSVKAREAEIREAGKSYLEKTKDAAVTAWAPDSVEGQYRYTDEKVR